MPTQTFNTIDVVRLEVENDPVGLANLLPNQEGNGGWGWLTPTTGHRTTGANITGLAYFTLVISGGASRVGVNYASESMAIAPGQYAAAYIDAQSNGSPTYGVRLRFEWLDAAGAVISSSAQTALVVVATGSSALVPVALGAQLAPAGTVRFRLRFDLYDGAGGATVALGTSPRWWSTTVAKAATSDALAGLGYIAPLAWTNILGPTHDMTITRGELEIGLLTATVLDAALDPATTPRLRPGRKVRVTALDAGVWSSLFTGKIRNAKVTYDYARTDAKRARIALTAVDNVAKLATVTRTAGYAAIDALRIVLEGCGVPWNVNGQTASASSGAAVVANNPNATALDQVAVTRDSVRGYAWVDRAGVAQVWDAASIATAIAATLDEDDYSALLVDYDTDRCINTVNLKYLRINLATGETVEVPYGPYVDQASADQWDPHSADFTIQGITETAPNMAAYAAAVLVANATPVVRVNELTLPIATPTDVAKALLDLYDLVTINNTNAGLADSLRITDVEHQISTDKWLARLQFATDGGVAPPQPTAPVGAVPAAGAAGLPVTAAANVDPSGVRVLVRGDVGEINISAVTTGAVAAGANLFTLPPGTWPVNNTVFGTIVNVTTGAALRVHVTLAGNVEAQAAVASGVTLRGQVVVPL